ncbi:MAG: VWA domain-containing protein [Gammaproteobacteria bacterium]
MTQLAGALRATWSEWGTFDLSRVVFGEMRTAVLCAVALVALAVVLLVIRGSREQGAVRGRLALAALLPVFRGSSFAPLRHLPLLVFVAGVPFFIVALADPFTAFAYEKATYPGRRIAVMIDASTSMNQPFATSTLTKQGGATYFATVAAAEYFMKLRMQGPHKDLISLIEFGSEAYVITPFTTDYENVLLSLRLIAAPSEWERFPDQGTIIIQAIRQATQLFRTFDFLEASGNLMVIFSDGQDTQTMLNGRSIDSIMAEARRYRIPVYFIRMAYNKSLGSVLPDEMWQKAVAGTGGRFFPGADEKTLLRAVHEIDKLEPGRVDVRHYQTQRPHYAIYALCALTLWLAAAVMRLGFRQFRSFP